MYKQENDYTLRLFKNQDTGEKRYFVTINTEGFDHTEIEISYPLYTELLLFVRHSRNLCRSDERHEEQSELREGTLFRRAIDTAVSPEDVVIMNEQTERLYQGMDKLSPKQRSRLIYYYFHKMSFTEIAEIEGCCRQVVQRSIENAKKKLKKFLE